MKILIAPDSFKGSLTAKEVATSIKRGIENVSKESVKTVSLPLADGGEGTMFNLVESTNGYIHNTLVSNPLGKEIKASYGITGDGTKAIIELASASGLQTLKDEELDPCITSTYGTGELILDALEKGIRSFIICLGGSATNDCGVGLLKAIGYQFFDKDGKEIDSGGASLSKLKMIDDSNIDKRIKQSEIQVAFDVTNPLVGKNGASNVFGPQKGASKKTVAILDKALFQFAKCVEKYNGKKVYNLKGGGAAGGTAAGLYGLLDVELKSGFEIVKETLDLNELFEKEKFDLVFTGEGKIDNQTAYGKTISGVVKLSKYYNVNTIAIVGSIENNLCELYNQGLTAAFSIVNAPMSLENSMKEAKHLIYYQSMQVFRLISNLKKV